MDVMDCGLWNRQQRVVACLLIGCVCVDYPAEATSAVLLNAITQQGGCISREELQLNVMVIFELFLACLFGW